MSMSGPMQPKTDREPDHEPQTSAEVWAARWDALAPEKDFPFFTRVELIALNSYVLLRHDSTRAAILDPKTTSSSKASFQRTLDFLTELLKKIDAQLERTPE